MTLLKELIRLPLQRTRQLAAFMVFFLLAGDWFSLAAQHPGNINLPNTPATKDAASASDNEIRRNEFGVWGGGSWMTAGISGTSEDVKMGILGLRYARVLASGKLAVFKYTADVIPFAALSYRNKDFVRKASGNSASRAHPTVYGAGVAPIGFQVSLRPQHRLQPFANFSGGCLYFADPLPNQLGKRFNFTAELGIGAQILTGSNRAISLGYKLHHTSNAGRGAINPGFGSNLFYLGFSVFK